MHADADASRRGQGQVDLALRDVALGDDPAAEG